MSVNQEDAIQMLIRDHEQVEQLFGQLEAMTPGPQRDELIGEVIRELSVHAAIEEKVLYPAVRESLSEGEALADEAIEEHQQVKDTLAAIEAAETSAEQDPLLRQLLSDVRHHVLEEEREVFPKLRAALGREGGLLEMGTKLEAAKKSAPTRPHPQGAAASIVDKARDALRRD